MNPGMHFLSGNIACAEGAIAVGCRFFAGYPITPSTEIAEHMAYRLPQVKGIYVQMEDELASMAAIIGASWGGMKAMTATSGPGFSLMQENIGLAVMTETPCVVVNVQRGAPSTGLPTLVGQGDVMQARWGSHGSYEIIALCPNSPQECFDLTVRAFNLSEKYRVPVILLMDECVGHMYERVFIPEEVEIVNRKKPLEDKRDYLPFLPKEDLVPEMALAGEGFRIHVTGLTHDERGYPATNPEAHEKLVRRLCEKIRVNKKKIVDYEGVLLDDSDVLIVAYGAPSRTSMRALREARKRGIRVGLFRLKTIWPFPEEELRKASSNVEHIVVPEINYGQLVLEVERVCKGGEVHLIPKMGGRVHSPREILEYLINLNR
ncbi:2-oxoglutarate synthase subunit alpha [Candidatus Bathyarchaeota archaeon ex4484_205]|nr:MAG: 2-oxoglutarate synthase subunit alpha [Candidatus Bathyarchaeota archaeon ex4484_205]RLF91765.1 MAG: 2-oxoacid:acceptor oxidoreductase subunit alpha [Thermococci archaeon]RLF96507.1 MAG: 2-oxoacid:acceptor oxidoreductase subunit alpha [Thermococci archaeon]HDI10116.1 2-oxoacid:acceptor oxidoreductase subunit alpha [Euryarchaeota archaeon]